MSPHGYGTIASRQQFFVRVSFSLQRCHYRSGADGIHPNIVFHQRVLFMPTVHGTEQALTDSLLERKPSADPFFNGTFVNQGCHGHIVQGIAQKQQGLET